MTLFFVQYLGCLCSILSQISVCCSWDYKLLVMWSQIFNQMSGTWSNFQFKVAIWNRRKRFLAFTRQVNGRNLPCKPRVRGSNPSRTRVIFFFFFCLLGNRYIWIWLYKKCVDFIVFVSFLTIHLLWIKKNYKKIPQFSLIGRIGLSLAKCRWWDAHKVLM